MKSYAEQNNRSRFNWNKFLDRIDITPEEWEAAKYLATSWTTCACGVQCSVIPRAKDYSEGLDAGAPLDDRLRKLGLLFMDRIEQCCMSSSEEISVNQLKAKETLDLIEERSTQILMKMKYDTHDKNRSHRRSY